MKRTVSVLILTSLIVFQVYGLLNAYTAIVRALNKGMDWTDESWVYELSRNLAPQMDQVWGFQFISHVFVLLSLENVLYLRIMRLFCYLIVSFFLSHFAFQYLVRKQASKRQKILISSSVAALSTIYAFSYPPRYISYNELSAWVSALLLVIVLRKNFKQTTALEARFFYFIFGTLTCLLFFIKFSTAIVLTSSLLLLLIFEKSIRLEITKGITVLKLGVGLTWPALVIEISTRQGLDYIRKVIEMLLDRSKQESYIHPISDLLRVYLNQFMLITTEFAVGVVLPSIAVFILLRIIPNFASNQLVRVKAVFFVSLLLLAIEFRIDSTEHVWNAIGDLNLAIIIFNLVWSCIFWEIQKLDLKQLLTINVLNWLPVICALGTNNTIGGQTMFAFTGCLIALVTLVLLSTETSFSAISVSTILSTIMVVVTPFAVSANTTSIYRTAPVESLTERIREIKPLRDIYLTPEESQTYSWLAKEMKLYDDSYGKIPLVFAGFNFAFKNDGFSAPWMDSFWPATAGNLRHSCDNLDAQRKKLIVIAPSQIGNDLQDLLNQALGGCNEVFPESFNRVGKSPNGQVEIWSNS